MPFPPSSASDIRWLIEKFFFIFKKPAGFHFHGIAAFLFIIGCVSMYSRNRHWLLILLSPIFVTLLVSGFHWYPFAGRLLLFFVPAMLIFIAEGTGYIRYKLKNNSSIAGVILIGILFIHPVLNRSYNLITHRGYTHMPVEDIKPVMRYIKEHIKDGDVLYLYHGSYPAFSYYAERYGLADNEYISGVSSRGKWKDYISDLNKLDGNKRVWLLFSHVNRRKGISEEKLLLYHLDNMGKRLKHFKSVKAAVYLYDLS